MTNGQSDSSTNEQSDSSGTAGDAGRRKEWMDDAEKAWEGAGEALRAAWNASRDSRLSALESAKQAARQLGEAIERGVDAAKTRRDETPATEEPTPPPPATPADTPPGDATGETKPPPAQPPL